MLRTVPPNTDRSIFAQFMTMWEKEDLSMDYLNLERKFGVARRFLEIITMSMTF